LGGALVRAGPCPNAFPRPRAPNPPPPPRARHGAGQLRASRTAGGGAIDARRDGFIVAHRFMYAHASIRNGGEGSSAAGIAPPSPRRPRLGPARGPPRAATLASGGRAAALTGPRRCPARLPASWARPGRPSRSPAPPPSPKAPHPHLRPASRGPGARRPRRGDTATADEPPLGRRIGAPRRGGRAALCDHRGAGRPGARRAAGGPGAASRLKSGGGSEPSPGCDSARPGGSESCPASGPRPSRLGALGAPRRGIPRGRRAQEGRRRGRPSCGTSGGADHPMARASTACPGQVFRGQVLPAPPQRRGGRRAPGPPE
jgi:hypothetical protein